MRRGGRQQHDERADDDRRDASGALLSEASAACRDPRQGQYFTNEMAQMLVFSVDGVDSGSVAVDVSNVCRARALPLPVGLHRLDLVLDAWREQICRHAEVFLVADDSLLPELERVSAADLARARRMQASGELQVVPVRRADDVLLDWAQQHGACVLSDDGFRDKRRDGRPAWLWNPQRFFAWEVRDGAVRIVPRASRGTRSFDISRAIEQKAIRAAGITKARRDVLSRRWACTSDVPCVTRQMTPDVIQVLPAILDGVPCCPGCGAPLQDRGARVPEAELKVAVDGETQARFTLRQGRPLTFGRLTLPDTPAFAALASDGAFDGVGRRHVELRREVDDVYARPVDDRHAVRVRPWDKQGKRFGRERELPATGFTAVGLHDRLLLGEHVSLRRSGRSIAEAAETAELAADADAAPWQRAGTGEPDQTDAGR